MSTSQAESFFLPSEHSTLPTLTFRPLILTKGKLEHLWENFSKYPQAFDDIIPRTFEEFKNGLMAPYNQFYEFLQGDETIGLASATNVRPWLDASMHLVMFDRRLRGREDLLKSAMADFMFRGQLRRLTAQIPEDNKTGLKLVTRLGFKLEGIIRKAHLRDGIYRDYHVFGILREELLDLDRYAPRPRAAGGDGLPLRGAVREQRDEVPGERVHTEDEGIHAGWPGNSAVLAREVGAEGGDSGDSL